MKTKKKKKRKSDYTQEYQDAQRNQYPGYFVGGKIPPYLKYPNKKLGFAFGGLGIFLLGIAVLIMSGLIKLNDNMMLGVLIIFSFLYFLAGIRIIFKK